MDIPGIGLDTVYQRDAVGGHHASRLYLGNHPRGCVLLRRHCVPDS